VLRLINSYRASPQGVLDELGADVIPGLFIVFLLIANTRVNWLKPGHFSRVLINICASKVNIDNTLFENGVNV